MFILVSAFWRDLSTQEENQQVKFWALLQASYSCSPIQIMRTAMKKEDFSGRGTWMRHTGTQTSHTFLQLTELSSRCEPQINEANKGSISKSSSVRSLEWSAQLSPVQQQHTVNLVVPPLPSPALGLSELLLCYTFQTRHHCKCKTKLEISAIKMHPWVGVNKNQHPFPLHLVTQVSLLAVPLIQSNL